MSPEAVTTCYAWHEAAWTSLWARPEALHHALLITGAEGIGKRRFAAAMAARLLCETPRGIHPCGICVGCHWLAGGNHPDYRKVELESDEDAAEGEEDAAKPAKASKAKAKKPSTQIKIDQIRALEDFIYIGSHRNGRRVVIVEPAEALNPAAANALLKVLEEPPPNVYFLLVSSNWRRLLPTLRSRCRRIELPLPETATAVAWLKEQKLPKPELALSLAGGAPLKAIEQEEKGGREGVEQLLAVIAGGRELGDPIAAAARWDSVIKGNPALSMEDLVDMLQKWLHDLLRCKQGVAPRFLTSMHTELQALAGRVDANRVMRFNRDLLRIRASARHPLNPQLFLEDIAARYALAIATPAARKSL